VLPTGRPPERSKWTVDAIVPPTESEHLLSESTSLPHSTPPPPQSSGVFYGSTTPQVDHGNAIVTLLFQILEQQQKQTRVMEEILGAVKDIGGQRKR